MNKQLNRVCKWRFGVWLVGWLVASSVCMIVSNEQLNRVCKRRVGMQRCSDIKVGTELNLKIKQILTYTRLKIVPKTVPQAVK